MPHETLPSHRSSLAVYVGIRDRQGSSAHSGSDGVLCHQVWVPWPLSAGRDSVQQVLDCSLVTAKPPCKNLHCQFKPLSSVTTAVTNPHIRDQPDTPTTPLQAHTDNASTVLRLDRHVCHTCHNAGCTVARCQPNLNTRANGYTATTSTTATTTNATCGGQRQQAWLTPHNSAFRSP